MAYSYLKSEQAENLHKYNYRSQNNSLCFKYLLDPLSKVFMRFLPKWIQ